MPGRFTTEVTPHHLTLTTDDFREAGPAGYIMPPLRSRDDVEALWHALGDGVVDAIGTDHAPHAWVEKIAGDGDLRRAMPGFPGVETFLPAIFTAFAKRGYAVTDFVNFTTANPARLFGLYPRKGAIAVGSDADIAIVDDSDTWTIDPSTFRSQAQYSPYAGHEVTAHVDLTMVRGKVVFENGEVVGGAGDGCLQTPFG
jgi:dihydroorotase-like cyclic amidohydrolase